MSKPLCIRVAGSKMCPDYIHYTAYVPASAVTPQMNLTSVALFDQMVQQSATTRAAFFGALMRDPVNGFDCPAWDGTGLRYLRTALCAYFVGLGYDPLLTDASNGHGTTCNNLTQPTAITCTTSVTKFSQSWDTVFSNPAFCPNGATQGANLYRNDIVNAGMRVASTNATKCSVGETTETQNCGFLTVAEATNFCAVSPANEPCCAKFPPPANFVGTNAPPVPPIAEQSKAVSMPEITGAPYSMPANPPSPIGAIIPTPDSVQQPSNAPPATNSIVTPVVAGVAGTIVIIIGVVILVKYFRKHLSQSQLKSGPESLPLISSTNVFYPPQTPRKSVVLESTPFIPVIAPQQEKDTYKCLYPFAAVLADEIDLHDGDEIKIQETYDDGWGFGINTRTSMTGFFPLETLGLNGDSTRKSEFAKRVSSIYGYAASTQASTQGSIDIYSTLRTEYTDASTINTAHSIQVAAFDFEPCLADELPFRKGDQLEIHQRYEDGWASGLNLRTYREGVFPLEYLHGFSSNDGSKKLSVRLSSLG